MPTKVKEFYIPLCYKQSMFLVRISLCNFCYLLNKNLVSQEFIIHIYFIFTKRFKALIFLERRTISTKRTSF